MSKRLLLILFIIFTPLAASAGEADPTMEPLTTEQAAPTATPAPSDPGLGPQASGNTPGGSNADTGSLQPAGISPLQSTTGDSTGLTSPTNSLLQAPASGDYALQVLAGEADGPPHQVTDNPETTWDWLAYAVIFGLAAAGIAVVLRDRRRFREPTSPKHP